MCGTQLQKPEQSTKSREKAPKSVIDFAFASYPPARTTRRVRPKNAVLRSDDVDERIRGRRAPSPHPRPRAARLHSRPPWVPRLLDQEDALAPNPPRDLAQGGGVVRRARRRHRRGPLGFPPRRSLPGRRPRERRVPPQRARARSHRHLPRGRRRARARGDA